MGGWDVENVFKEECIQFYNLRKQEVISEKGHIGRTINILILITTHIAKQINNESKILTIYFNCNLNTEHKKYLWNILHQ